MGSQNENSILFYKHLLDFFEVNPQEKLTQVKSQVINKLNKIYDLAYTDLRFIIDLDYLDAIKFIYQYHDFINKFDVNQSYQRGLLLQNTTLNDKGLSRIDKKINGHIISLTLHDFNLIPSSINSLPELENLKVDHCNFKGVNLNHLKIENLKHLVFSNNQMDEIPKWVWSIAKKRNSIKKYIKNGIMVSQAGVIALLEILSNQPLKPMKKLEHSIQKSAHFYKLDDVGSDVLCRLIHGSRISLSVGFVAVGISSVIGIFIANLLSKMGIFPNQICDLKYLEELHLVNQGILFIPDCLIKLQKLKILNLSNNQITSIPQNFEFLHNIEYIDLHVDEKEKEFFQVPASIKKLHKLKMLDLRGKNTKNVPELMKNLDSLKID